MTLRALVGLVVLNAVYLAAGATLLWALRGCRSWSEAVRLTGLAYLLGLATLGAAWCLLVIAGVPFGPPTILLSALGIIAISLAAGLRLGRPRPARGTPRVLTRLALVGAAGIALTGVFFEALFRAARLQGLYAFDGWAFWIPKAKAIYALGGLDERFFVELPGPTYPPLVPILDAAAFHAMGSADVVTLHLQYWFFTIGFTAAVAGLLWRRVPSWILWPSLVLVLVLPRTSEYLVIPQADFLLQFLFCTAALLGALWIVRHEAWLLVAAAGLLGAAVLTKREGVLLTLCLLVGLAVASLDRWRFAWPRIALAGAAVAAIGVPWRLWYRERRIGGEAPADLNLGDRAGDALRLSAEVLFSTSLFSLVAPLAVASIVLAGLWGSRRLALLFGVVLLLVFLGGAWITVAYPDLPVTADEALNPIVRYTTAAILLAGVSTPLLLAGVWRADEADEERTA